MVIVRRALLIVNPVSRRAARQLAPALAAFAAAGVACTPFLTTHAGHARELATAHSPGADAVFTLGGDGTAMEVLDALADTALPVGVLPGGTGNLIARALATPLRIGRAVGALVAGEVRAIDLARLADGRRFAFAAGVGIDATMVATTTTAAKRRFGVGAYVRTGVAATVAHDVFTVRATVDGTSYEFRAAAALIANFGAALGGLLTLGPGIRPDDGMLDLCVFSPADVRDAIRIGWRIVRRDFAPDSAMHYLQGRSILLETDPPRVAQADGELLGSAPLDVRVEPGAALLLAPATPTARSRRG